MFDQEADRLYRRALERGHPSPIWPLQLGRSRCLLDLASVEAHCAFEAEGEATLQIVAIDRIVGSEGRAHQFDCNFNPVDEETRERWLNIAAARQKGKKLPPVVLIQVGSIYFCRDGHHRISVGRALGQTQIEARVLVWHVDRPAPWDMSPATAQVMFTSWLTANTPHAPQVGQEKGRLVRYFRRRLQRLLTATQGQKARTAR